MQILKFPSKQLRAEVIAEYVREAGYKGVVVFSCGHASEELKKVGLDVVDVAPRGLLRAGQWFTPAMVHMVWPDRLDATSGHLPMHLMIKVAQRFRGHLGDVGDYMKWDIPSGSGETIICLRMAYPKLTFVPMYDRSRGSKFKTGAPLNYLVLNHFPKNLRPIE